MTHPLDLLSAHLDAELAPEEEALVSTHLATCEGCANELAGISEVRTALRSLTVLEPPIPLLPAARRSRRWVTAVASSAAVLLAVGLALGPGEPSEVFDLDTLAHQHIARTGVDPGISTLRGPAGAP